MMYKRLLFLVLVMSVLTACGSGAYAFNGGTFDPPKLAPDFAVPDQYGQTFRLSEQGGKVVMLVFGFTHCPDFCPTVLGDFKTIKQALGTAAERVRFVMVTVDPQRDTPQVLQQYMSIFDSEFIGLSPPTDVLAQIERDYGIAKQFDTPDDNGNYGVGHTALVFVIDRSGQLRLSYSLGISPEAVADDVRQLMRSR